MQKLRQDTAWEPNFSLSKSRDSYEHDRHHLQIQSDSTNLLPHNMYYYNNFCFKMQMFLNHSLTYYFIFNIILLL